jgi:mono/diheme cytochrome c family protein
MKRYAFILLATTMTLILVALAGCGGTSSSSEEPQYSADLVAQGNTLYNQTCFTCHGPDGKGIPNLGKDLTISEFFGQSTDAQLVDYVKTGRPVDDPANTTGVAMPPKGGFNFLTDDDILAIIAYIRTDLRP